jgi:hypothetical protein
MTTGVSPWQNAKAKIEIILSQCHAPEPVGSTNKKIIDLMIME